MSISNKFANVESRLKNLTNALYLDGNDDVVVRTGFAGNIVISGNVNIPGEVTVNSTPENPVHVHLTELGTYGNLTSFVPVGGNVSITQMPAVSIASLPEVEIKNDSGNPVPISANTSANSPTNRIYVSMQTDAVVADSNYFMNVARDLVTGHQAVTRSAYLPATPSTETSIWVEGGIYPFTSWTAADHLYVISTSASDTAQNIYIVGLDASYNRITETVTTNGTTAVQTTQHFLRIHSATIVSANKPNVGEITFRLTSGTGTVVAHIGAGLSITKLSQYTVPAGYTAYILYGDCTTFRAGSGNIGSRLQMMVRPYGGTFVNAFVAEVVNGYYRNDFTIPMVITEKSDIDVQITADANNTTATCNYGILLIQNGL